MEHGVPFRVVTKFDVAPSVDAAPAPRAGADRRKRIIGAAADVIEEHGPDVPIGAVADRAGIPRPHIYRHFSSKTDLDEAVARHAAREVGRRLQPLLTADGSPAELVGAASRELVAWAADHPNLYRFRAHLRDRPAVQEYFKSIANSQLHRQGYPGEFPQQTVVAVTGLVDSSVLWWLEHSDALSRERLVARLTAQVCSLVEADLREIGVL